MFDPIPDITPFLPSVDQIVELTKWVLILSVVSAPICFLIVGHILFTIHMKRTSKEKWSRECSVDEPIQLAMYAEGLDWSRRCESAKRPLHLINDGLNLYSEYYDFGHDRAVIVVPGRTEGLRYGYYFARPYEKSGYNVLVIDQRAHGESDGDYNTIGFEEHRDVIAWAMLLHDHFGVRSVLLHGICIGASCALFAITAKNCPDYIDGLVAEGMYPTFYDSFKNHVIERKKPTFPTMQFVNMWMKLYTGHTMKYGPIHVIGQLNKPILMLHSREDAYSLPNKALELYELCPGTEKELVWFEHGAHSQLRYTDADRYDGAIEAFILRCFPKELPAIAEVTQ